jgi:hypothetical protein
MGSKAKGSPPKASASGANPKKETKDSVTD